MISSNNLTKQASDRFRRLASLTVFVVYLVILAGGIVRGTGSGMGCPDWPKCFGRWIPPTEVAQLPPNYQQIYGAKLKGEIEFNAVKTWIEYVNRLLGVLSGFLVFATLIASITYRRVDQAVFWGSLVAFLLIGVNGWLGSRVVATELAQYMITLHLLLAILVVFALLFVLVRSSNSQPQPPIVKKSALRYIVTATLLLSLIQVLLGTQVREALDDVIKQLGYEKRSTWIDSLNWSFYVHRSFSILILAFHVVLIYQLRKTSKSELIRQLSVVLFGLILLEILTGVIMAYMGVPAAAQPTHLMLAMLMLGVQFVIWLLLTPTISLPRTVANRSQLVSV